MFDILENQNNDVFNKKNQINSYILLSILLKFLLKSYNCNYITFDYNVFKYKNIGFKRDLRFYQ